MVRVPVLSKATTFTVPSLSMMSPPFTRNPRLAPLPIPATMATGAEMTRAPGQAMTRSVRASSMSLVIMNKSAAEMTIAGVYQREKDSRNFWVFAFLSWASSTMWRIRAKLVSSPTFSASINR
jgi:hypothetical protein